MIARDCAIAYRFDSSVAMPDNPVDFDALLKALGAADAEPPPLMRQLLDGMEPIDQGSPDDRVLAELEAWLATLVHERDSRFPTR